MSRTFKFKIAGRGADTDAPTVEDLLDQLRDYFEILKGVEEAVAEGGRSEIEWRVVAASKNSPLAFEIAAFSRQFAMNVDRRAEIVLTQTAIGLQSLQTRKERPEFFSEKVLARAEKLFDRVTNGLSETTVDFGSDLPTLRLDRGKAYAAAAHTKAILRPPARVYKELGSVEGFAHGFDQDGWGNPILKVRHRLTGDEFTCRLSGEALEGIETRLVGEVLRTCRVRLFGTIHYKALGRISRVDANRIKFFKERSELPEIDDILDENFTGGIESGDYLERLRDGNLS